MPLHEMADRFFFFQVHNIHRGRALRLYDVISIVVVVFFLYVLIFSGIIVKMVIKNGRITAAANSELYMNETHFDLSFLKSSPVKTEYKTPADEPLRKSNLMVNNGGIDVQESLNQSRFHQQANGTTFESLRKSNLKVNNGGIGMPEPVHFIYLESVSPTPPLSTTTMSSLLQRQIQEQQMNNILEALIGAGDFVGWTNLSSSANLSSLPLTATFFIPENNAMSNHQTLGVQQNLDPSLIAYHIIPQRLSFSDLQQLKPNTRIPTLLHSKFIVVTNNSLSNFTIDGSKITYPDLYANSAFTVHGVDKILDYSVYDADSPPVKSPPMADADAPSPPLKPKSFFPARGRDFIDGSDSNIPFSIEKFMVFLGVSIFLLQ